MTAPRRRVAALVAVVAWVSASSSATAQTRSSPFAPPPADDRTFVTDGAPLLDTACLFRSQGPIIFDIAVTRFVGEVAPDGTLLDPGTLIQNGVVAPSATLQVPAFDVDFDTTTLPGDEPERDRVSINGHDLPSHFLTGTMDVWKLNSFEVPIQFLRFPERAAPGSSPTPAMNTVRIDIDTANTEELWCTAIDWGLLTFKAMSPVILIHGNNSDGGFFARQGFKGHLDSLHIPNDNSISMVTAPIVTHSALLDTLIPGIVQSFGVDSVHLVVHSKGGLDTRDWLATYYGSHPFKVLTLTTLSTPHRGSVGADLVVAQEQASYIEGAGITNDLISRLMGPDAGTPDLTTSSTAAFNALNVPLLPTDIVYRAVGGNADLNGNGRIDAVPDEFASSRLESSDLATAYGISPSLAATLIDAAYQLIRNYASVTVVTRSVTVLGRTILTYRVGVATTGGDLNDTLVPLSSAAGPGFTFLPPFVGTNGRDHASIGNAGVAATVVPLLQQTELATGDFR